MNIIFAINVPYPYGMAGSMRIRLFAEYLANQNLETKILITNQDNGINNRRGVHNGVTFSSLSNILLPYYIFLIIYPLLVLKKLNSVKKEKEKNILVIYGDPDIYTLPFIISAKILGFKVILDVVEDRALTEEKLSIKANINLFFGKIIFPFAIKLIDGVIVISKYLEKKYKSIAKLPVVLIPVSAANLKEKIHRSDTERSVLNIVYSGSFGTKDGVEYLVEAFHQIRRKYNNINLVLIGTPKKKFWQTNHRDGIEVTGYLPDKEYQEKLSNADILCMTRIDSEFAQAGFPFKLGEYLATAKPVIATDVTDVSFYLKDKKDVVLAQPSNTKSLVDALEYLITKPKQRKIIGKQGRKQCENFFNPEINSKMLCDFIIKINS